MTTPQQLRYEILKFLRNWMRTNAGTIPDLKEIAQGVTASVEDVSDQVEILDSMGAVKARRTVDGGATPFLTGNGRLMLEELTTQMETSAAPTTTTTQVSSDYKWDVFICHASEDKEPFGRRLAESLRRRYKVWYDEFSLTVGDSLRQKIDYGLVKSRFGVVVLSPNFFAKKWTRDELDGLTARESDGHKVILPVWLNIDFEGVRSFSPILAGRYATKASDGMERVESDLVTAMEGELPVPNTPYSAKTPQTDVIVEDSEHDRPRFDVQGGGGETLEPQFTPDFKVAQFSGDPIADLQWRIRGPRLQGMAWRHSSGAQLNRTHFTHRFDLSEPLGKDDFVQDDQMGFEVRFRWHNGWRSEIHLWPISRRDLGHKVMWDIGSKILPPLLIDNSKE